MFFITHISQAAAHIHRYLSLDESILLETTADTTRGRLYRGREGGRKECGRGEIGGGGGTDMRSVTYQMLGVVCVKSY